MPPDDSSIGAAFLAAARIHSERNAILSRDACWTYLQLEERSRRWAGLLSSVGDTQHQPVAILMRRGAEMVAAMLGAALAGRPWSLLPVGAEPALQARSLAVLGHCTVAVEEHGRVAELCGPSAGHIVTFAGATGSMIENVGVAGESPAAICLTSGSTGAPRGVALRHDATIWNARESARSLAIGVEDRYLWLAGVGSAATSSTLFTALLHGTCVLPCELAEEGLNGVEATIRGREATILHAVPTVFRRLARTASNLADACSVRVVKLGGEAAYATDLELVRERFPTGALLVNGLGMSEANGNVCHAYFPADASVGTGPLAIGRPLSGVHLSLVDADGNTMRGAGEGRLRVAGTTLAAGYWNGNQQQVAAFEPSPDGVGRQFQSEDICRRSDDGTYFHIGRADDVVKVRGTRVSLAEVEACLRQQPQVADAVVLAGPDAHGGQKLTCWIEPVAGKIIDDKVARAVLAGELPREAVPTDIIMVDRLPMLAGGKIDRRGLLGSRPTFTATARDPSDRTLSSLCALFGEALGREPLLAEDNIFELGTDSLIAATLVAAIEARCRCVIDPATLVDNPTPRALFAALGAEGVRPALRLNTATAGLPIWLFTNAGDSGFGLLSLARALGNKRPIYGFVSGIGADGGPALTIGAMAVPATRAMRSIQPEGPYVLAGSSFGGWFAFDVAQKLRADGCEVLFVAMLDSYGPGYNGLSLTAGRRERLARAKWLVFRRYRRGLPRGRIAMVQALLRRGVTVVRLLLKLGPDVREPLGRSWLLEDACIIAGRRYRPRLLDAQILAFQAEPRSVGGRRPEDRTMGWSKVSTKQVISREIFGRHGTHLLDPYAGHLASNLEEEIDRALESRPSS